MANKICQQISNSDLEVSVNDLKSLFEALGLYQGVSKDEVMVQMAILYLNQRQYDALVRCSKLGWRVSQIVWNSKKNKCALGMFGHGTAAWMLPSAEIVRAPNNKNRVTLPKEWC